MSERMTLYDLLGVSRSASPAEIKNAYHDAMKHYHPDVNPATNATSIAGLINEAWETLRDPAARENYDARLTRTVRETAIPRVARPTFEDRLRSVPWFAWAALALVGVFFWKYVIATAFIGLLTYRTFRRPRGRW